MKEKLKKWWSERSASEQFGLTILGVGVGCFILGALIF